LLCRGDRVRTGKEASRWWLLIRDAEQRLGELGRISRLLSMRRFPPGDELRA